MNKSKLRLLLVFSVILLGSAVSSAEAKQTQEFPTKHLFPRLVLDSAQKGQSKILASLDFFYGAQRVPNALSLLIDSDSLEPAIDGRCSGHMGTCEKHKVVKAEVLESGFIKEFFGNAAKVVRVSSMLYMSDGSYTELRTVIDIEGAGLPFEQLTKVSISIPVDAGPYWSTLKGDGESSWIQMVPRALNDYKYVLRHQGYYPEAPAFSVLFLGVVDEAAKIMTSALSVEGQISATNVRVAKSRQDIDNIANLPREDFEFPLVKRPVKSRTE